MGLVPLLTREGEVLIAKRMERGQPFASLFRSLRNTRIAAFSFWTWSRKATSGS
jgi:Sigma-70 factor, region 1.2